MPPAPVKITSGAGAFKHTVAGPLTNAVGKGFTVMITEPACGWLQMVDEASVTLINVYVKLPGVLVGAATVTELPTVVVSVRLGPLLIL